jgi:AcrR family transcriptional regulator
MDVKNRKAEQSEATRAALMSVARYLFAERGYADTPTEEIVERAGVTRGALYHHFRDKEALFRAVFEELEQELLDRATGAAQPETGLWDNLQNAMQAFLDASLEPDVQRIVLIDAPAVLGWKTYRDIAQQYSLGVLEAAVQAAMDAGIIEQQPARPLARLIVGALEEACMLIGSADDPMAAREEAGDAVRRLLDGLRISRA